MNVCVSSLFIYIAKSQKIVILPTGEGCFDDWCKKNSSILKVDSYILVL